MTYVALAFSTSGDSPRKGDHITELLALRINDDGIESGRLHLCFGEDSSTSDKVSLAASFAVWNEFIGPDRVITHDGHEWAYFLRYELRDQPRDQLRKLIGQTLDVSEWSQRTYPKQRQDLTTLLKRLGVKADLALIGLERDARAVVRIGQTALDDAAPI